MLEASIRWQNEKLLEKFARQSTRHGFNGQFFRTCWDFIKDEVVAVFNQFHALSGANFAKINSSFVAMLPKKDGADSVGAFRPISLIHAVAKIVAKMMANRLAPFMHTLVSRMQSAFIKTRSIHDNFLFVKNAIRKLHSVNVPALLLKLDIAGAFDNVSWSYKFELMP